MSAAGIAVLIPSMTVGFVAVYIAGALVIDALDGDQDAQNFLLTGTVALTVAALIGSFIWGVENGGLQ